MTNDLDFLHFHDRPLDWEQRQNGATAAAARRLKTTAEIANTRRMEVGVERFCPPKGLVNAINAAIASRSPLLLTGEPGTGKTQTAYYLARYFGLPEPFHFQVRSDSTAADLRYNFDAVAYLHDAYLAGRDDQAAKQITKLREQHGDPRAAPKYLKPGKLWQAYRHQGECVLLIDEIDKAPRDFPNDLLQELSDHRFDHPFLPTQVQRPKDQAPPLLVITSNGERRLPDPFLRRCIVHHIVLDEQLLDLILSAWRSSFAASLPPKVEQAAVEIFKKLRTDLKDRGRQPGAAELLIWLGILATAGTSAEQIKATPPEDLPGIGSLIKEHDDWQLLRN